MSDRIAELEAQNTALRVELDTLRSGIRALIAGGGALLLQGRDEPPAEISSGVHQAA